ncbi:MAG TPA: hypothetical protein VFX92_08995 [Candidatus Krumholzibacteria bacterium]|nr:hypothetical protein [Candidatus Krumholzibacteria bacterium]
MKKSSRLVLAALAALLVLPAMTSGEVVRLRDGSSLRARLLTVEGDTLTFRLAAGPRVKFHRDQVLAIAFDDSLGVMPTAPLGAPAVGRPERGSGRVTVSFKDKRVSSKIQVDKKKELDAHLRANYIVVELLLDGVVVYSTADTTMDKTIYKGHITEYKNDAELADFSVEVPAGVYQCEVIIRNQGETVFHDDFLPEPLHAALVIDDFEIRVDGGARVDVGIDKGSLKLGRAKLYRVE